MCRLRGRHTRGTAMQGQYGVLLALFVIGGSVLDCSGSLLYPRESESREVKLLDGVWKFRVCTQEDQDAGFREKWFARPLEKSGSVIPMPVPASFNDITQNATLRDYVGWAWYQTEFFAPRGWWNGKSRVFLRFGSVHYVALVYLDNKLVAKHVGGHLPFGAEVTKALRYGGKNRVTVAVSNTLTESTIPQGSVFKPQDAERSVCPLEGPQQGPSGAFLSGHSDAVTTAVGTLLTLGIRQYHQNASLPCVLMNNKELQRTIFNADKTGIGAMTGVSVAT